MSATPLQSALDGLGALAVPGVTNYPMEAVPEALTRAQLPALLVLPGSTQNNRLFQQRGEGFQTVAFADGARTVTAAVTHLLLAVPVAANLGLRATMPTLTAHIDAYLVALAGDVTLGGALLRPAEVSIDVGSYTHGGTDYHACAFRHLWTLAVTP